MRFAQAYYSVSFWLVAVLLIFAVWAWRKKRALLSGFAEKGLWEELASLVDFRRQALKYGILIFAVIFAVIALMRPQWGFQWQEVKRRGLDILIAIDTSKSMLASDVKPNRIERSKLAVKDLVKRLAGDRVGLIAFAGTAFLQCPLTVDYDGFLLALGDINVNTIPRGGTSISSAIDTALGSYEAGESKYRILVVITDGEDHEGNAGELAERARREGVKIFCIGIGTAEGELIQVTDEAGNKSFLKDSEGNIVKSHLNEELLKKIALATDGMYVRSSGAEFGLDLIYEERLSKMERREIKSQMNKLYHERFQIPLAVALILLAAEPFIGDRKRT